MSTTTAGGTTTDLVPGVHIPLIGLGTWPLVGEDAAAVVSQAIANGYRHLDTAENYGNEEAVGEGIRRSGIDRGHLFLTTKFNTRWHSRAGVRQAFAEATRRLGTDYLDLFLVHWPNPAQGRFVEACEGLQQLMDEGCIRSWGVSNFKPGHLQQVQDAGLRVPLNQVQVDPEHGQPAQLAYHAGQGMVTAAYSPLGRNGHFLSNPAITGPALDLGKTPAQIVLRWHVQHGRVAIPKSADHRRQRENLDVFSFALTQPQLEAIDALETGAPPRLDSDTYFHKESFGMMSPSQTPSERPGLDCDVLVIGSGAGGLSAAVTAAYHGLKVVVVEKAAVCGGATSWSGGWAWTPGNPLAKADGVNEDRELFRTYLRHRLGRHYQEDRVDAFLAAVPHMVGFFHNKTSLQFVPGARIKDIYGDTPGAGTGHRSVGPKPINARRIKPALRAKMRHQLYETSFLGMGIMAGPDLAGFLSASRGDIRGIVHAGWRVGLHLLDLLAYRRNMQLVNGTALTGRLLKSADDLGVEIRVSTPARHLLTDDSGKVTGAVVSSPQGDLRINASRGVVLAAGGFPNDASRRKALFPQTPTGREHWTLAPKETTGDGITMGQEVGARFQTDVASPAAWCPVSLVPYRNGRTGTFPHIMDRAKPGSIGVRRDGKRFVNEANGYYDYVEGLLAATPEGEPVEAWQIADAEFVRKYPLGMAKPLPVPLFPYLRSGYLKKGNTIEELAAACGIDPQALARTVADFNENARKGIDPDFNRGATEFNAYGGDPRNTPNPSLRPLEKGPFYAVKIVPGSFGTFAGLAADSRARVLDTEGQPIQGLYVAGNDQASVMGGHYPAGGINLGPALTFGYIAGRDLANATHYEDDGSPAVGQVPDSAASGPGLARS